MVAAGQPVDFSSNGQDGNKWWELIELIITDMDFGLMDLKIIAKHKIQSAINVFL